MKEYISTNPNINCVYIYELSRLSRIPLVLYSIRDYLVERRIQLICLKPYFRLLKVDGTMSQTGSLMFSLFSSRADVLRLDEDMQSRQPVTTYDIAAGVEALRAAAYDDDTLWSVVYDKCSLTATTYFDCDWDNPLSFSIAE